jgi:hypothetical protein
MSGGLSNLDLVFVLSIQRFTYNGSMVYLTTHAIKGVGTTNYSTQDVEGEYDEH